MTDPLSSTAAALQILSKAMSALNATRERARSSKDPDLKGHISTLYDEFLNLKEVIIRLTNEAELKRKPEPEIRQVGAVNYYFVGEKGPYCQPCYDGRQKLSVLTPPKNHNGGVLRQCQVCNRSFFEKPKDEEGPAFGIAGGDPQGWMR